MRTQRGITLVALIITIVVLLILAVVSIGAVQNSGIIGHATNAKTEFQAGKDNEAAIITYSEGLLTNIINDAKSPTTPTTSGN